MTSRDFHYNSNLESSKKYKKSLKIYIKFFKHYWILQLESLWNIWHR